MPCDRDRHYHFLEPYNLAVMILDCYKIPYQTVDEAVLASKILLKKKNHSVRPYKCPRCGNYHLTKYSKEEWKRKETARRMKTPAYWEEIRKQKLKQTEQ